MEVVLFSTWVLLFEYFSRIRNEESTCQLLTTQIRKFSTMNRTIQLRKWNLRYQKHDYPTNGENIGTVPTNSTRRINILTLRLTSWWNMEKRWRPAFLLTNMSSKLKYYLGCFELLYYCLVILGVNNKYILHFNLQCLGWEWDLGPVIEEGKL